MTSNYGFAVIVSVTLLAACASPISKEVKRELKKPVDCSTAKQDIALLEKEKASTAKQTAAGVTSILPIGLISGVVSGTAGDKAKVATGEYNKQLVAKIAEIKSTCGVK